MKKITSSNLIKSIRFSSSGFHADISDPDLPTATASQEKIPGFDQSALRQASIQIIGCGGIGTSVLNPLARKGLGRAEVYDRDEVEVGNLGRQNFSAEDVGQNKAICAARNASHHSSWGSEFVAHPMWFEDAVSENLVGRSSAAVIGPDNDSARVFASRYFYPICPTIFVGIGTKAQHGYVFLQSPGNACFGCLFPDAVSNKRKPCPGTPAMIDILLVTAGLVLTALDSVLMKDRHIQWNYWDVYPAGTIPTQPLTVKRRKDCPICGKFK